MCQRPPEKYFIVFMEMSSFNVFPHFDRSRGLTPFNEEAIPLKASRYSYFRPFRELLQSVPPTPATNQYLTLPTLEDIIREASGTLFTLMGARDTAPTFMCTIMEFPKIVDSLVDLYFSS